MRPIWIEEDELLMPIKRQGPSGTQSVPDPEPTPSSTVPPSSTTSVPPSSTVPSSTPSSTTPSSSSSVPSSTPSSTPPSSTPSTTSPTSTPTTAPTSREISTRPDGVIVTRTLTAPAQTSSRASSEGGKSFFDNKAQVGAVFGVAGLVALVFAFFLITTCLRRRRAKKFDKDVAEAAAAAAAANADPFIGDDDERQGSRWDPHRNSAYNAGYGRIGEDPYGYAAAGVVGGGPFARQPTHYQKRNAQNPQNAYNMNDFSSSNGPTSMYSGTTNYNSQPGGASYYMNDYSQQDYARPSFSSAAPGIAGVGSGGTGGGPGYAQDNQQLRYRGQQQANDPVTEDAYGGYVSNTSASPEHDNYSGAYMSNQSSAPYSRTTTSSPPIPTRTVATSPPPPPSYSGHGHGNQPRDEKAALRERPTSSGAAPLPVPPTNNMAYPPGGSGTPDESWTDGKDRILRVANE